jgi:macrocin-O-methyltransferase TylF-like protien
MFPSSAATVLWAPGSYGHCSGVAVPGPRAPVRFDVPENNQGTVSLTPSLLPAVEAWGVPPWSKTMIGTVRLDNVEECIRRVRGVWRGGTAIFMRGVLRAYGVTAARLRGGFLRRSSGARHGEVPG